MVKIGIITVSDRASRGEYIDKGGPTVQGELEAMLKEPFEAICRIVPDEVDKVSEALIELADSEGCPLIITTGGTGPALRDITPEATRAVIEKELPGFCELMRSESLKKVPTAILSRQVVGIRGKTLIINLPGSLKAIGECLRIVFPAVPDCIDLLGGPNLEVDPEVVKVYRPHTHPQD